MVCHRFWSTRPAGIWVVFLVAWAGFVQKECAAEPVPGSIVCHTCHTWHSKSQYEPYPSRKPWHGSLWQVPTECAFTVPVLLNRGRRSRRLDRSSWSKPSKPRSRLWGQNTPWSWSFYLMPRSLESLYRGSSGFEDAGSRQGGLSYHTSQESLPHRLRPLPRFLRWLRQSLWMPALYRGDWPLFE